MWSAAILAGGQATRFGGRDKSALVVGGRTILDRQIAALSGVTDDVLIVGGRTAHPGARRVADHFAGCGPIGGLHAALSHARGTALFVVGCDMPYVTAALARHLLDRAQDVDIVVPHTDAGYHPLCAVYARSCLPVVAQQIANGDLRMSDLITKLRTRVVADADIEKFGDCHRLLANVNTPGEYAGLEALQGHTL